MSRMSRRPKTSTQKGLHDISLHCPAGSDRNLRDVSNHNLIESPTRVSMEVIVTSKLVYFTYLRDVSNLLIKG